MVARIAIAALVILYLLLVNQHPITNFDDTSLNQRFAGQLASDLWKAASGIFLAIDMPNEYRTYSLARLLHLFLYRIVGPEPLPYFILMSSVWTASAGLIYFIIRDLGGEGRKLSAVGLGAAAIWLFSPFSICRTFHHFSYTILPALLLLVYVRLWQTNSLRMYYAVPLLIGMALSGETVIPAALVAIILLEWRRPKIAIAHAGTIILALAGHLALLSYVNGYNFQKAAFRRRFGIRVRESRFVFHVVGAIDDRASLPDFCHRL